jgi:hypothetical protein
MAFQAADSSFFSSSFWKSKRPVRTYLDQEGRLKAFQLI